ncbi:hypothetical protein KY338_04255 [Candidatus Woesearchaeota archaeon]|nr:hypothetical protein [Candidatus Woesearchaeota archaeon]MBW3005806.1 hypothetical protein [Candidatus Woesearchaeota archaeon]
MKKIIMFGIAVMAFLSAIAIVEAYNPYTQIVDYGDVLKSQTDGSKEQIYGHSLQGYDPYYKSDYPYTYSIYTDPLRGGIDRVTNLDVRAQQRSIPYRIDQTVYLAPPGGWEEYERGYPPYAPRGTARIYSSQSRSNAVGEVIISTKDIAPSYNDNTVYEAWLYSSSTGYRTSLGVFKAIFGGVGALTYKITTYLDGYDYVIITKEPKNDNDPRPSDDIVLIGEIQAPAQYVRPFTYTQSQYGYVTRAAQN